MWRCEDSQEVGLEAAILQRVRNSSLVEHFCAEDVTGLKQITEDTELYNLDNYIVGRGAFGRSKKVTCKGYWRQPK